MADLYKMENLSEFEILWSHSTFCYFWLSIGPDKTKARDIRFISILTHNLGISIVSNKYWIRSPITNVCTITDLNKTAPTNLLDKTDGACWLIFCLLRYRGTASNSAYYFYGYPELWILRYPAQRYHAVPSPGFEPSTLWLRVRRPNNSAIRHVDRQ
jgi:hypothetical protein